jgi:hypothetical protein
MAQRKLVRVDDETVFVPAGAKIIDVVPDDVQSVTTQSGALIPREAFARVPVPDGFETNLSAINKGAMTQASIPRDPS